MGCGKNKQHCSRQGFWSWKFSMFVIIIHLSKQARITVRIVMEFKCSKGQYTYYGYHAVIYILCVCMCLWVVCVCIYLSFIRTISVNNSNFFSYVNSPGYTYFGVIKMGYYSLVYGTTNVLIRTITTTMTEIRLPLSNSIYICS